MLLDELRLKLFQNYFFHLWNNSIFLKDKGNLQLANQEAKCVLFLYVLVRNILILYQTMVWILLLFPLFHKLSIYKYNIFIVYLKLYLAGVFLSGKYVSHKTKRCGLPLNGSLTYTTGLRYISDHLVLA